MFLPIWAASSGDIIYVSLLLLSANDFNDVVVIGADSSWLQNTFKLYGKQKKSISDYNTQMQTAMEKSKTCILKVEIHTPRTLLLWTIKAYEESQIYLSEKFYWDLQVLVYLSSYYTLSFSTARAYQTNSNGIIYHYFIQWKPGFYSGHKHQWELPTVVSKLLENAFIHDVAHNKLVSISCHESL